MMVEAVAVEAIAPGEPVQEATLPCAHRGAPEPIDTVGCSPAAAEHAAPVFERTELQAGDRIAGPALIREAERDDRDRAGLDGRDHRARSHDCCAAPSALATRMAAGTDRPDPVLLELFNNLFMNVAEQTGAVLQNTSLSVNIKERLDFSCAIFDARAIWSRTRRTCRCIWAPWARACARSLTTGATR